MRSRTVVVGNDVVDLLDPRTFGKSADARFVGRVLDETGRAALIAADDADLELWCRWAAKEAAYKVVSKLEGAPPPFVHRAFAVRWEAAAAAEEEPAVAAAEAVAKEQEAMAADAALRSRQTGDRAARPDTEIRHGWVRYGEREIPVVVRVRSERGRPAALHAVACAGAEAEAVEHQLAPLDAPDAPWAASLDELRARFTERELDAVGSVRSAAVRLGARGFLARRMRIAEPRIEIVCDPGAYGRRPPRVLIDGASGAVDVSLSHDGRWIAWAAWMDR